MRHTWEGGSVVKVHDGWDVEPASAEVHYPGLRDDINDVVKSLPVLDKFSLGPSAQQATGRLSLLLTTPTRVFMESHHRSVVIDILPFRGEDSE